MIGVLIAILVAALVYWLCLRSACRPSSASSPPILVLVSGIGTGGYGFGRRGERL